MDVCPNCGERFESLGIHWNYCGHPQLSDYKKDLLIGGLMSDATLTKGSGRAQFTIYNTNKKFLQWYDKELDYLSNGVRLYETGDEKHKRNIEYGFDEERQADYKDVYCLTTVSHPFNDNLYSWYDSGKKQYPNDIELTPTKMKMWYCGDGNLNWDTYYNAYAEIGCNNESDNVDRILSLFDKTPVSPEMSSGRIRFYGDTENMLSWIGGAPKGMSYKWEIYNRERYNRMKDE